MYFRTNVSVDAIMASIAGREEDRMVGVEVAPVADFVADVVLSVVVEDVEEEEEVVAGAGGWSFLPPFRQAPVPLRSVYGSSARSWQYLSSISTRLLKKERTRSFSVFDLATVVLKASQ